jgi:hypothetical protein
LSGHPNNLAVSRDGRKVYAGISQAPARSTSSTLRTETNVKTIPVEGGVHNVYVHADGKFAVLRFGGVERYHRASTPQPTPSRGR